MNHFAFSAVGNDARSTVASDPGEIVERRRGGARPGPAGTDRRASPADRRIAPRFKQLKGGHVVWPNGESVTCVIRNLSETGACLEVYSPVPGTFALVIDADQSRRSCQVMWQKPVRVGVKFT